MLTNREKADILWTALNLMGDAHYNCFRREPDGTYDDDEDLALARRIIKSSEDVLTHVWARLHKAASEEEAEKVEVAA